MAKSNQPVLRVFTSDGLWGSAGYKSGRRRWRETPVRDSMDRTRSAGTRPAAIQPETVPCDLRPNARARALCPPAAVHASNKASLVMKPINAQTVNSVNAATGNRPPDNARMGRTAVRPASAFWARLEEALGDHPAYRPLNANSLSKKLGMSQGSVYRWYIGDGKPELDTALKLAKDGGVSVDWLLNNIRPKYPIAKDPALRELLELCEQLDAEGRDRILRAARGELLQQRGDDREEQTKRGSR